MKLKPKQCSNWQATNSMAARCFFYNPAAWQGGRHGSLSRLGAENFRQPDEVRLLFEYSTAHEPVARSIPIYQEVVRRFPHTKAAQDAMFTVVVAHERLADYNGYWSSIYGRGLFVGERKSGQETFCAPIQNFAYH